MFYGGPCEVMWHASSRVGCGIDFFITGRDPAGVGHPEIKGQPLYDVDHGKALLKHEESLLKGVKVYDFKLAALNTITNKMEFKQDNEPNKWKFVSGSEMRRIAAANEEPPMGFMSPAGWKVLCEYYATCK
jgi:3'-phosphoadenosine 5'-phosphosulfate synthase